MRQKTDLASVRLRLKSTAQYLMHYYTLICKIISVLNINLDATSSHGCDSLATIGPQSI